MNRKELYAKVKELNLQEKIKEQFGENYTRVSNAELAFIIASYNKVEKPKSETKVSISTVAKKSTVATESDKCDKLIEVLKKKHILLNSEIDYINS